MLIRFSGNRSNQLVANLRLQQVYDIIYRFVLEIGLDRVPIIDTIRERVGRVIFKNDRSAIAGLSTPAQVRVMLQTLGADLREIRPDGLQPRRGAAPGLAG